MCLKSTDRLLVPPNESVSLKADRYTYSLSSEEKFQLKEAPFMASPPFHQPLEQLLTDDFLLNMTLYNLWKLVT